MLWVLSQIGKGGTLEKRQDPNEPKLRGNLGVAKEKKTGKFHTMLGGRKIPKVLGGSLKFVKKYGLI